jgi:uncharacterized protein (TIGR02996 family)
MTTEDDFQAMLDANPEDHTTRLIFADRLDERGDPRGPGYRALGERRISPCHLGSAIFDAAEREELGAPAAQGFWWCDADEPKFAPHHLPFAWFMAVHGGLRSANNYPTRREAEDAAALAFAQLPADRRAELLRNMSEHANR